MISAPYSTSIISLHFKSVITTITTNDHLPPSPLAVGTLDLLTLDLNHRHKISRSSHELSEISLRKRGSQALHSGRVYNLHIHLHHLVSHQPPSTGPSLSVSSKLATITHMFLSLLRICKSISSRCFRLHFIRLELEGRIERC